MSRIVVDVVITPEAMQAAVDIIEAVAKAAEMNAATPICNVLVSHSDDGVSMRLDVASIGFMRALAAAAKRVDT